MIKIINGTYGYRNPNTGIVEAKTVKSLPFALPEEREAELVASGVAEYVGEDVSPEACMEVSLETSTETSIETSADAIEYSDANTVAELKAIAERLGIKVSEKATKRQILTALDSAKEPEVPEEDCEDDAPDIVAALPE